ncbi:hypothetical protein OPQ81_007300 [Rhizoctonia solani]|nr:hypothetical protein OPQ81_007300 [Rhizoctonia solani]
MELPNIQRLGPLVIRVLGQNPGKFTLQGTNTYLIGRLPPYILIDTGEGKPEYIPQLRTALESSSSNGDCPISDIIITHKHMDHHGGLIDVLDLLSSQGSTNSVSTWHPPRIHIHPLPAGVTDSSLNATLSRLKPGDFTPSSDSSVFSLNHGSRIQTADESAMLEVVHTPGHTADSISLILFAMSKTESVVPEALFTADTVLGAGTAVFENLSLYMQSLQRLVDLPIWSHLISLHPGHGPTIPPESSKSHIETYISHRQARENQIIDVFKKTQGKASVGQIVESLYAEYPRTLWPAAAHGVGLHLQKLAVEQRVKRSSGNGAPGAAEYDGVKLEQVGAANMDTEWELIEVEGSGAETKL